MNQDGVPKGWFAVSAGVFVRGNDIVVTGTPIDDSDHNCDYMGCSSMEHVLYRGTLESGNEFDISEGEEE